MDTKTLLIKDPCHEDWDAMKGNDERRFCDLCAENVHNLSEMTRRQAEALIDAERAAGRRVCVQYEHDAKGRLFFRQRAIEATAPAAQRRGVSRLLAGAAVVASMLSAPLAGASTMPHDTTPENRVIEQERRAASSLQRFGLELEEEVYAELEVEAAPEGEEPPACGEGDEANAAEGDEGGEGCGDAEDGEKTEGDDADGGEGGDADGGEGGDADGGEDEIKIKEPIQHRRKGRIQRRPPEHHKIKGGI